MEPKDDDEMDLINSEFESLVAGLNLDQSSPRTYLDDLEDIEANERKENEEIYQPPIIRRGLRGTFIHFVSALKGWWSKPNRDDGDGAVV